VLTMVYLVDVSFSLDFVIYKASSRSFMLHVLSSAF